MELVMTMLKYLVLMNLVLVVGTLLVGGDPDFNLITNVTVPVVCAFAEWEMKKNRQPVEK